MKHKTLLIALCILSPLGSFAQTRPTTKAVAVPAIAFHPKSGQLAAGSWKTVTLFDTKSGKKLRELQGLAGMATGVAFSSDGKLLAASGGIAGKSGEVRLWDVDSGKLLQTLTGHSDTITALAFSSNSTQIAAASYDQRVSLWKVRGNGKPQYLKDHTDSVYGIAFSPDGKRIASVGGDRTVKLWDSATGKRLYTLSESTAELYTVAFHPNGKQIAAGGVDKALRIWKVSATGGTLTKAAFAHEGAILKIAYSKDGRTLVSSGEDKAVKRWDAVTLAEQKVYPAQSDWAQGLALSSDNRLLAVGRYDGSITLYEVSGGKIVRELQKASALAQKPKEIPKTSTIAGAKLGGRTRPQPKPGSGGVTLFMASLGNVAPVGMKRGQTLTLTLSGGLISDAAGVFFDDPAITGKIITPADKNPGILRVETTVAPSARAGIHRVVVQTPHGATNSLTFAVGNWTETTQSKTHDTLVTAQLITFPTTLVGAMDKPGEADHYAFVAKKGDELVFEVMAQSIRSRLQAVITLLDDEGKTLKEVSPRSWRPDPILGYRFEADGKYIIRIKDFQNAAGGDVAYRLNAGRLPFVERVFPLGVQAGTRSTVTVTGYNMPPSATIDAPKSALPNLTVALPLPQDDLSGLSEPLGARLAVGDEPEIPQLAASDTLENATPITVPASVNARLWHSSRPNATGLAHFYRFAAKKGQRLIIETQARRLGSPIDTEIEITDLQGKPLERAVLRAVAQTEITLNDRDSRSSGLRLVAWDSFHINDYLLVGREVIQILALPKGPDDDVLFRNYRGMRQTYFATTPEFHSVAAPVYKVEVHKPGSKFSPNGYPLTRLIYRNDDGGALQGKDSFLEFEPPADGAYLVKVQDARQQSGADFNYRLRIHAPRPNFKVTFSSANPNLPQGGGTLISIECERYDGFDGAIALSIENLPSGFQATETIIEPTENSATLLLTCNANAVTPTMTTPFRIVAQAKVGTNTITHLAESTVNMRLITVLLKPDLIAETDKREVVLSPGGTTYIETTIERQNNFGGRVPLDVRNLPHGVRVTDIGLNGVLITEQESSRRFALYCEPWVKPQTRPIYVMATPDGGVATSALPLMLKIGNR